MVKQNAFLVAQHDNRNCILPFLSLNEIAKCSELTQQQKSERAGRLIKSNPNVGRLLVKLKNEKGLTAGVGGGGAAVGVSGGVGVVGGGGVCGYDAAATSSASSADFLSGKCNPPIPLNVF